MTTVCTGGQDDAGLSVDAESLPHSITQVYKNLPSPRPNGHVERVIKIIAQGPFRRLVVSDVSVPNGRRYASIRFFVSKDGAKFTPTPKGVMINLGCLDEVIAGLKAVAR